MEILNNSVLLELTHNENQALNDRQQLVSDILFVAAENSLFTLNLEGGFLAGAFARCICFNGSLDFTTSRSTSVPSKKQFQ